MKIEKDYINANEQTSIERTIQVPIEKVKISSTEWGIQKPTEEEDKKYFDRIKQEINLNEEDIVFEYSEAWCDYCMFEIITTEKWRIELQNKIKKQMDKKMKCKNCIHYDPVYPIIWINKRGIEIVEFIKTCGVGATEVSPDETCKMFER